MVIKALVFILERKYTLEMYIEGKIRTQMHGHVYDVNT